MVQTESCDVSIQSIAVNDEFDTYFKATLKTKYNS